ncbi:MAG: hypothetical protein QOJ07_137 [Thermoleophilaceae bacterium]|nr:hypothetical protein [Thermoleophilaceae bacterium]
MRRGAALLAAVALLAGCGGGGGATDADRAKLDSAEHALAARPRDAAALGAVIQAAYGGASHRYDVDSGGYRPDARPYLQRAAAVWPRYVAAGRGRVSGALAAVMVRVYGDGLGRAAPAADAAQRAVDANPTAAGYLELTTWSARAGDRRTARLAAQKAVELATPADRDRVREGIRQALAGAP